MFPPDQIVDNPSALCLTLVGHKSESARGGGWGGVGGGEGLIHQLGSLWWEYDSFFSLISSLDLLCLMFSTSKYKASTFNYLYFLRFKLKLSELIDH